MHTLCFSSTDVWWPLTWIWKSEPGSLAHDVSFQISASHVTIPIWLSGEYVISSQNVADKPRQADPKQNLMT